MANDLEMTKLCAKAMGIDVRLCTPPYGPPYYVTRRRLMFDPLRDDTQAMALVKHLRLHINDMQDGNTRAWGSMVAI